MPFSLDGILGVDEDLPVTNHNENCTPHNIQGKVVLVTGASRGIGKETALQYARAGASLAIVARIKESLNETRDAILAAVPDAEVLVLPADVRDDESAEYAVQKVLECFKRLDILIANAGAITPYSETITKKNRSAWWNTFEVSVRGIFNFVSAALPALESARGYVIAISSVGAQLRIQGGSDGCIAKHTVNRLVEYIVLGNCFHPVSLVKNDNQYASALSPYDVEYPGVRAISLAPGFVPTQLSRTSNAGEPPDTAALPAATMLYLTSGRADWLSGRYYSANWDISEVERDWKDLIVEKGGLVNKLCIPRA
ncbi:NAD-P-binding protein [Multifurca ochricompacta]|uniref:NAD-P-binding protein n=1 Tax=Multifurca ochricompacta TaxID=376703 RepID=A0AAD4LZL4_9AGAM|nr:NAD-P-binding protein [Multifurca ochricompacta]